MRPWAGALTSLSPSSLKEEDDTTRYRKLLLRCAQNVRQLVGVRPFFVGYLWSVYQVLGTVLSPGSNLVAGGLLSRSLYCGGNTNRK